MTTGELIRQLQEADPSGELHVRMNGGVPTHVHALPGYYDGSYSYIDDDGRYVITRQGSKVDICSMDLDELIWDFTRHDTTWEQVREKIVLDEAKSDHQRDRNRSVLDGAMQTFSEAQGMQIKYYEESKALALKRSEEGWLFFQNKKVDIDKMYTYYMWRLHSPDGKVHSSSVHDTQGIIKSGLFERIDCEIADYYKWVLKSNQ